MTIGRLRLAGEFLYVLTEVTAWFVALSVVSTLVERAALRRIADEVNVALTQGVVSDVGAANAANAAASRAADTVMAGAPWWLLAVLGLGAYFLVRIVRASGLGQLGFFVGVVVSVLVLNIAWRMAVTDNLRFWDFSGIAQYLAAPETPFFERVDAPSFAADPDPDRIAGRSKGVVVFVIGLLWFRFLVAGRARLTFDRVLRSFSVGFPVVLLFAFIASAGDVAAGPGAFGYFVLGVLSLSVANATRPEEYGVDLRLRSPWALSVGVTVGAVALIAAGFALFAALNVGTGLSAVGAVIGRGAAFILALVFSPVFWFLEFVLSKFEGGDLTALRNAMQQQDAANERNRELQSEDGTLSWVPDLLRVLAVAGMAYLAWVLGQRLFNRGRRYGTDRSEATRGSTGGSGGLGDLLRRAFSRPAHETEDQSWLRSNPAYWLFGRMLADADERRFARRLGETPLEFAGVASTALHATVFEPIALEFDRARYGGYPADERELQRLGEALAQWEATFPVTDELRRMPGRDEEAPDVPLGPVPDAPESPGDNVMPPV